MRIMAYDYEKDCEDWEKKYGKCPYVGNPKDLPQIPNWLKGVDTKCQKE